MGWVKNPGQEYSARLADITYRKEDADETGISFYFVLIMIVLKKHFTYT